MDFKNYSKDVQCIYWLGTGKCGKCESVECQSGWSCCLDQDELILLENMINRKKDWSIAFASNSFFVPSEDVCSDREEIRKNDDSPLVKLTMNPEEVEEHLIGIGISDGYLRLLKAVPVILGINSLNQIEKRDAVVQICIQSELGESLLKSIFEKVLGEVFYDWATGESLDTIKEFVSDLLYDLDQSMSDVESRNRLSECIDQAYEKIDANLADKCKLSAWREKYSLLYNDSKNCELESDIVNYFKGSFSSWPAMEIILFMIREIICMDDSEYNVLNPYVESLGSNTENVKNVLRIFQFIVGNIRRVENEQMREEIGSDFLRLVNEQGNLWGILEIENLAQKVRNNLPIEEESSLSGEEESQNLDI